VLEPYASRESVVKKLIIYVQLFRRNVNDSKRSGTSVYDLYVQSLWYYELVFLVDQETPDKSWSTVGRLPVEKDEDENNQCTVSVNQLTVSLLINVHKGHIT
jgi:hypothetical protein